MSEGARGQQRREKRPRPNRVRAGRPPRGSSRTSAPSVSLVELTRPRPAGRGAASPLLIRVLIVLANAGDFVSRSGRVGVVGAIAAQPASWVILVLVAGPAARGVGG
jgi:hypothetical protein